MYKLYNRPLDRLKDSLGLSRKKLYKEHYALKDVSFDIGEGECVGIIGTNGSGKSTILKIITGVLAPTAGTVTVNGRISALLELGAGFNPEYSGMENIFLNGTMLGFSEEEINARLDEILSFADIGDFIHQPVKTYSSGMFVRLAFAVAINIDPEILVVDEALSVGDVFFQATLLGALYSCSPMRSFRNSVIMKYGLPSRAGMPTTGASIWAKKEPQLLPRSKLGCSRSMMERISFSASLGCKGRSGVSTTAVPSNASFKAFAIGQLPVAKNPCRNNIFFMLKSFDNDAPVI